MKIHEVLKVIKLKIVSSQKNHKIYYGEGCRELFFSDCYENLVGSFIASIDDEVMEIKVKAKIKTPGNKLEAVLRSLRRDSEKEVVYQWINEKYHEKRDYFLNSLLSSQNLMDIDFKSLTSVNVIGKDSKVNEDKKGEILLEKETSVFIIEGNKILQIIEKVCEGNAIDECCEINEELNEKAFIELSKIAYKEDISIKKLLNELLLKGVTINDLNMEYGEKGSLDNKESKIRESEKDNVSFSKEDVSTIFELNKVRRQEKRVLDDIEKDNSIKAMGFKGESSNIKNFKEIEVKQIKKTEFKQGLLKTVEETQKEVKLPEVINGTFEVGKGFMKNSKEKKNDEDSLRERINPTKFNNNDFQVYADGKMVLSNLKVKQITD